jgi:hypothetical protein
MGIKMQDNVENEGNGKYEKSCKEENKKKGVVVGKCRIKLY